jgi:hypothetical protein
VKLGIPPSQASEAVNALWKEWGKKDTPEGWNVYGVLWPSNNKWTVALCSQKLSGGPLYKFGKSKSTEEMELPKQTCALIPISEVFDRVTNKLSGLLKELKNLEKRGKPIMNLLSAYIETIVTTQQSTRMTQGQAPFSESTERSGDGLRRSIPNGVNQLWA